MERVRSKFNIFDVEVVKTVELDKANSLRYHAGVQYASIRDHSSLTTVQNMKWNGSGVRAGLGMMHHFMSGLGLYGAVNVSGLQTRVKDETANQHNDTLVFGVDGGAGVSSTKELSNGKVTARGGWMYKRYAGSGLDIANLVDQDAWAGCLFGLHWQGNV